MTTLDYNKSSPIRPKAHFTNWISADDFEKLMDAKNKIDERDERRDNIIGFVIFWGLVFLICSSFTIFLILIWVSATGQICN